jgi:hypothetical protein
MSVRGGKWMPWVLRQNPRVFGRQNRFAAKFWRQNVFGAKKNGAKIMFAPNIGGKMNGSRREIARSS